MSHLLWHGVAVVAAAACVFVRSLFDVARRARAFVTVRGKRGLYFAWSRRCASRTFTSPPPRWITDEKSERWVRDMLTPSTMISMILWWPFLLRMRQSTLMDCPFSGVMFECTRMSFLPSALEFFTMSCSPVYSLKRLAYTFRIMCSKRVMYSSCCFFVAVRQYRPREKRAIVFMSKFFFSRALNSVFLCS